jgi:hypothetical protein
MHATNSGSQESSTERPLEPSILPLISKLEEDGQSTRSGHASNDDRSDGMPNKVFRSERGIKGGAKVHEGDDEAEDDASDEAACIMYFGLTA